MSGIVILGKKDVTRETPLRFKRGPYQRDKNRVEIWWGGGNRFRSPHERSRGLVGTSTRMEGEVARGRMVQWERKGEGEIVEGWRRDFWAGTFG